MPASPRPSDPENTAGQKRNGTPGKKMGATDKQAAMDGKDFAKAIGINKPANVRDEAAPRMMGNKVIHQLGPAFPAEVHGPVERVKPAVPQQRTVADVV